MRTRIFRIIAFSGLFCLAPLVSPLYAALYGKSFVINFSKEDLPWRQPKLVR